MAPIAPRQPRSRSARDLAALRLLPRDNLARIRANVRKNCAPGRLAYSGWAGLDPAVESPVSKTTTQTKTRTEVAKTRIEVDVAVRQANLTSEEEKVLRMHYGIGIAPDAELQAHAAVADTQTQIAAIEQKAIAHARRQQAVIERLRRIDG